MRSRILQKIPNNHTSYVYAPWQLTLEQNKFEISFQILAGNEEITNDEYQNLCGL